MEAEQLESLDSTHEYALSRPEPEQERQQGTHSNGSNGLHGIAGSASVEPETLAHASDSGMEIGGKGEVDESMSAEHEGETSEDVLNWKLSSLDFGSPQKMGSSGHASSGGAKLSGREQGASASKGLDFESLVPSDGLDGSRERIQSSHRSKFSPLRDFRCPRVRFPHPPSFNLSSHSPSHLKFRTKAHMADRRNHTAIRQLQSQQDATVARRVYRRL